MRWMQGINNTGAGIVTLDNLINGAQTTKYELRLETNLRLLSLSLHTSSPAFTLDVAKL